MISEVHRFLFPNHSNNPHTGSIKTTNHSSSWQSDSINPQKLDIIGKPETMAYPVSSNRKGATYSTPFETDRTIISRSPSFTSNGYNSDDRSTHSNASDIMSTDDDVTTPINNGSPVSDNYTLPQLNISNQRTTMLDEPYYDHDDMNIKSKER
ncbi:9010_t:CDS:1, partial [Scutellospora calospora]